MKKSEIHKLAAFCKKLLIIQKVEDGYYISDSAFMYLLSNEDFEHFKTKFNSYKDIPLIPETIQEGETYVYKYPRSVQFEKETVWNPKSLIDGIYEKSHKEVHSTQLIHDDGAFETMIYSYDGGLGFIDRKYEMLFSMESKYRPLINGAQDNSTYFKTEGNNKPVIKGLLCLIMPVKRENRVDYLQDFYKENKNTLVDAND